MKSLNEKLASTSTSFKDILTTRAEVIKQTQSRRQVYSSSNTSFTVSDSPLYNPETINQNQETSLLIQDESLNHEIIESRNAAIENIEGTIAELGQIYQNFALLLSSQREAVQRIDENVLGKIYC